MIIALNTDKPYDYGSQVEDEYRVHWIIDNLPAATRYMTGFSADGNTPM